MESYISGLMLGVLGWAIVWKTVFNVSSFYMQRLHYENPNMTGSAIPGPLLMSFAASIMSWAGIGLTIYVWYRLGWMPAVALYVIPFILAMVIENIELFAFRFPTPVMSLVNTPIAIVSFIAFAIVVLAI
ncbi:hypothetical protein [Bradyrhizobium sp.]|uniref:hypothetical protein n=1 Tax=Bradyrhizobium sp. TaxID=376 RepID=UPI002733EC2F|nr:hypothetical protein [Bradyrhizobium sp.]MDP3074738.1 hypothetical protein [Bradyrhizobium sp.]